MTKTILLSVLTGALLSCTSTQKTLFVAAETKPCTGVAPMQCLQVKTTKGQSSWENFYSTIEGFEYEKGFEYQLLIKETKVEKPPTDASGIRYTLVKIVSKTPVISSNN